MLIKKLFLLSFALFFVSCASSGLKSGTTKNGKPTWVLNPAKLYPNDEYIASVGEGDTLDEAKQKAISAVSAVFKVHINSTLNLSERASVYSSMGKTTEENQKNISENIKQTTNETLINVKTGESFTDKTGRVYVVAYLNRAETYPIYKDRIMKNDENISYFIKTAQNQTEIVKKYAFLNAAFAIASYNDTLIKQLQIIYRNAANSLQLSYDFNELRKLYAQVASQMKFKVIVENDSENKLKDILTGTLTKMNFSIGTPAILTLTAKIKIENAELENRYFNVRWFLTINITDNQNNTILSVEKNQRESGISQTEAISSSYRSIKKIIKKEMVSGLKNYFDNFVKTTKN